MKTEPSKCQAMQRLVGSEEAQHYFLGEFCTFLRFCGNSACLHKINLSRVMGTPGRDVSINIRHKKAPQKIYAVNELIDLYENKKYLILMPMVLELELTSTKKGS